MALPQLLSNQPTAGYISWSSFGIQYDGNSYEIPAGVTNKKFTWWQCNDGHGNELAVDPNFNQTWVSAGGWVQDGAVALAGATSMRGDSPASSQRVIYLNGVNTNGGTGATFPLEDGGTYKISVWYKTTPGFVTDAGNGKLRLANQDAQFLTAATFVEQANWTELTVWAAGSATITGIQIQAWVSALNQGSVWIGAYSITRTDGAAQVLTADVLPELAPDDCLLFLNRNGVGVLVPMTQVIEGSLIVSGSIIGDAIAANQIDATHIKAGAVTANAVAAGAVTANAIAAGAITTDKLTVASVSDSLVANGSFEDGVQGWEVKASGAGSTADIVTGVASSGANALRLIRGTAANLQIGQQPDKYIPVTAVASRRWYISCRAGATAALANGFYLRAYWYQADRTTAASTPYNDIASNRPLTTSWGVFEAQVAPPANARYMSLVAINAASGSTMYIDEIVAHEVTVSAMIQDGAISAAKIAANTITANNIATGAITADELAANAVIANKIAAGAIFVDHLSPALGSSVDISANQAITLTLGNAQQYAEDAKSIAKAAGVAAGYAADQAAAAAAAAAAATDATEKSSAYYQFTETDLRIGRPGGGAALSISDTGITFLQNEVPVSLWDGGQMIVDKFVGSEVILANHKIETRGTRTIVRSM
ncbi:hypothetical protein MRBLMI12_000501 [Microbacterium sp. LMI12-1-1.1]|uniref:hypothetical protein n=1 Tax=Microbacterium sp. LMI12-1-1.1 TaxID=3135225 RepID=UPI00342D6CAB